MKTRPLALALAAFTALGPAPASADTYTPGEPVHITFEGAIQDFLYDHCYDCHDDATQKGDLNLMDLGQVDETNAALWKSVWAQVTLQEMPPKKKDRPEVIARLRFSDWIVSELTRVMKDKGGFKAHLDPQKGNFLDHNLLFGPLPAGIKLAPTSSPARIWRVTPQEHITRLNELINTEPKFNPKKPGLRTHGDAVPTNHGGELKLYFGTDRITEWQGGTVAYATSVKSIPVVLSSARKHGFENYPDFYTVNSAEATQILNKAEDILRYMAYGPLSIANPEQITDDPATYEMKGDIRGLPTALVYNTQIVRPMTPVYDLMKNPETTDPGLRSAVDYLFEALTFRPPTQSESDDYLSILKGSIQKIGKENGVFMGLSSIFLDRDALFRPELVQTNKPDKDGRIMLQDWELGLALNHALRYLKPDQELKQAILDGRMRTRADVKRELTRILGDESIRKPRVLRFFKDYFDHDLGGYICKDEKALKSTGITGRENIYYLSMFHASTSTDRLIELILQEDKDVLRELLTTQKVVATKADNRFFGTHLTPQESAAAQVEKEIDAEKIAEKIAQQNAIRIEAIRLELPQISAQLKVLKSEAKNRKAIKILGQKKRDLIAEKNQLEGRRKKQKITIAEAKLTGPKIYSRVSHRSFGKGSMKPERTLATAPAGERLGILTHPSWLVSHSDAMDNHAILRGRWIRERLLGGGIPDIPITVDAMLPDEPYTTLRSRMRVTRENYCWTCHAKMDPLGLPFEMYNHAGLLRKIEAGKPVDTTGEIINSGDPALDGPVENALEMIQKLADSERVHQVFVRHAFRFWMGRNETLNDAPILQEAFRAYSKEGSMNALIASLLTSDAFLYRKVER